MEKKSGIESYIIRRILIIIPTLLLMTFLVFSMIHLIPGDIIDFLVSDEFQTLEIRATLEERFGLNLPLREQYLRYLSGLLKGDWGLSLRTGRPVLTEIFSKYPNTIKLAILATILGSAIGIISGIIAAIMQNTIFDYFSMTTALFGLSLPNFWLGIMLMLIFSVRLRILPILGAGSLAHLVLPTFTLGTGRAGRVARLTKSSMLEVLRQDYIKTARAKGLTEKVVALKHAFKNAAIPVITSTGMGFARLLGGTTIVETVFTYPGIGRLTIQSIWSKDLPVIQGCIMIYTLTFILMNLIVDIIYAYLDPRIRYS